MDTPDTDFWYGLIFGMGVLVLGTIIVVVVLMQMGHYARARTARKDEERLVALVDRYERSVAATARYQEAAAGDLAEVRSRLDGIERLLREVE